MPFAIGRSHHELVLVSTFAAIRVAGENIFKIPVKEFGYLKYMLSLFLLK
jgi:hypothetical protein